jgi:hypothetical protein
MSSHLTIDFETRSLIDLTKTSVWRYAEDPSTEVLCVALKEDDKPPVWFSPLKWFRDAAKEDFLLEGCFVPALEVEDMVERAGVIEAHNAEFETALWHHIMHKRHTLIDLPTHKIRCSAAKAAMHALPRNLAGACEAMGVPVQKDKEGHALMLKMCKPLPPLQAQYKALAEEMEEPLDVIKSEYQSSKLKKRWYAVEHDAGLVRWKDDAETSAVPCGICRRKNCDCGNWTRRSIAGDSPPTRKPADLWWKCVIRRKRKSQKNSII